MPDSIRILQIGDIHLPEWQESQSDVDRKDKAFSKEIADDLSHPRLRGVLKRLHDIANHGEIDCVAVMGDLTSWGKTEFLSPAVDIVDTLVRRTDGSRPLMIGVPGNHDVDKAEAAVLGKAGKFKSFSSAFESRGWMRPPTEDCVSLTLKSRGGRSVASLLVNTSIGSWSTHFLPGKLAGEYSENALGKAPLDISPDARKDVGAATNGSGHDRSEQLFLQMDTPYISQRSVATLSDKLLETDGSTAIVVAHHNLLPQRIPRILPYGEMLNGGYFRQLLHSSNRNIVYLHGHIHEDPIEVISVPGNKVSGKDERKILTVSAPALSDGFNEITLFFGADNDVFLVRITKYRPNSFNVIGNYSDQDTVYIPLKRHLNELIIGNAKKLWQRVKELKVANWPQILPEAEKLGVDEDELEMIFLKLFCCGLVTIGQLGRPRFKWILECVE